MAKIKQLSPLEAQKIAAGEVVERPANVVKELLENALDAGATSLDIYLEDGGKRLIRIVDNGCGMSPEDARMSIRHHATSKIVTVDDLQHISTFGFRGEALSSIAAVSKLKIVTKELQTATATCLEIEEGTIRHETQLAANTGTDITVQDIFFNVPARRKFLKTKETEWRTIVQLFYAVSLTHHTVSFNLYHDGRIIYTVPPAPTLDQRVAQLFEPMLSQNTLLISAVEDRMKIAISGAVVASSYVRYDRNHIFVFVNNRWVKNHKLVQALIKGYQGMLQPQRYPAGFIFITIDPLYVDSNVHPRKEEVQFVHPRIIEELVESTVRKRLEEKLEQQLGAGTATNGPDQLPKEIYPAVYTPSYPSKNRWLSASILQSPIDQTIVPCDSKQGDEKREFDSILENHFQSQQEHDHTIDEPPIMSIRAPVEGANHNATISPIIELNYRLIGQLKATYILLETEDGLVFIDQHAAHERVMYERLRVRFENIARIRLLFPQVITLTKEDLNRFEPFIEILLEFGIDAQRLSDHEIIIQETPAFLKNQTLEDSIKQAISTVYENDRLDPVELKKLIHERIHADMSCKAAVKAGDTLSIQSMHELIKDLYNTNNKLTCPHGRPTVWELKTGDIQKKFKRDYR